jgi:hypothetical protein
VRARLKGLLDSFDALSEFRDQREPLRGHRCSGSERRP